MKISDSGSSLALRSLDGINAAEPDPMPEPPPQSSYNGEWSDGYQLDVNFG